MNGWRIERNCSEKRIKEFMVSANGQFIPPLAMRVNLDYYSKKLAENAKNFFLVEGGLDIGHAALYSNSKGSGIAFLSSFCVAKKVRGTGAALYLLEKVIIQAKKDEMHQLLLEVNEKNLRAVCFYKKNGFKHHDGRIMALDLGLVAQIQPTC